MNLSVVTQRGWGWLVASLVLLVWGIVFGWIEMISLASAGLVTFLSATIYALFRHAHSVSFTLSHHRVVVGEAAEIILTVENPTQHSLPGLDIYVTVGDEELLSRVTRLSRQSSEQISLSVPTNQRGQIPIGPVRVVRADPLGLISREVVVEQTRTLYVHPHTIALMSMSTGFVRDLEGTPTRDLTDNDLSFHALREYIPGDDRRNIHWKSTAKTGQFMIRQFEQTRRSHLLITLDTRTEHYASAEEFELAVSCVASLGIRALADTRDVSFLIPATSRPSAKGVLSALRQAARERRRKDSEMRNAVRTQLVALSTASPERLLDDVSGVSMSETSPTLSECTRLASLSAADVSVAFVVTSAQVDNKTLHAASVAFPAGVEVVVLSCSPEVAPSFRRRDRLSILTIGRLDDVKQLFAQRSVAA